MEKVGISVELAETGINPEKNPTVPLPAADSWIGIHGSAKEA